MSRTTLTPAQRAKVRAGYPAFTRKPSSNARITLRSRMEPGVRFTIPGSTKTYEAYFVPRNKAGEGNFAGIRVIGGRQKVGRNAPGYLERQRARGKIVKGGGLRFPDGTTFARGV